MKELYRLTIMRYAVRKEGYVIKSFVKSKHMFLWSIIHVFLSNASSTSVVNKQIEHY